MKKLLLLSLLTLSLLACDKTEKNVTKNTETSTVKTEEVKEEAKKENTEEYEILSYINEDNEKEISVSLNSNDLFETAVLTYRLGTEDKIVVEMERETSASGVIMKSTDKYENKVEYLSKGDEATFIINDVQYKTHIVK